MAWRCQAPGNQWVHLQSPSGFFCAGQCDRGRNGSPALSPSDPEACCVCWVWNLVWLGPRGRSRLPLFGLPSFLGARAGTATVIDSGVGLQDGICWVGLGYEGEGFSATGIGEAPPRFGLLSVCLLLSAMGCCSRRCPRRWPQSGLAEADLTDAQHRTTLHNHRPALHRAKKITTITDVAVGQGTPGQGRSIAAAAAKITAQIPSHACTTLLN